jgi:SmpA / OmlA family
MSRRMAIIVMVLFVAVSLALAGCSKINKENYDKIEVGMTYDEVEEILGTPDEAKDVIGTKSCVWGQAPETISIKFVGDKVVFHSARGLK